jgi:SM-20-related protein
MFGTINLENYFSKIAELGWAVVPLDQSFTDQLKNELENKKRLNLFKPASLAGAMTEKTIRNDLTCWIDENDPSEIESKFLQNLRDLQEQLRNYFRIALTDFEVHYAIFPEGHFYHKHTDQKANNNHRYFSFVIYLNKNWNPAHKGQLLIYDKNSKENDTVQFQMTPEFGQMILFRSDLLHEVEISHAERQSITGWIRTS